MADGQKRGEGREWLFLEYFRALMWPAIVLLLVIVFKGDVSELLKTREVDILGVRIGQALPEIDANLQQELDELRAMATDLAEANQNPEKTEELTEKIDAISTNWEREVTRIQQAAPRPKVTQAAPESGRKIAERYEREGFQAILGHDAASALDLFRKAEEAGPEYHNVSEIRKLLETHQKALTQPAAARKKSAWNQLEKTVLTKYSWGMPAATRKKLRSRVQAK